jgi:hypothetical protein
VTDGPPLRCLFCELDVRKAQVGLSRQEKRETWWLGFFTGLGGGLGLALLVFLAVNL